MKVKSIDSASPAEWDKAREQYLKAIDENVEPRKPNFDDLRSMVWGDNDVRQHWTDMVNKPEHYNMGIETWDYITSWDMGYLEGNIIKYVTRYKYKNGREDLLKAKAYLDKLLEDFDEN